MSKSAGNVATGMIDHLWLHVMFWAAVALVAVFAGRRMRALDTPLALIIALCVATAIAIAAFYAIQMVLITMDPTDATQLVNPSPATFDLQAQALRDVAAALISALVGAFSFIAVAMAARGRGGVA